MVGVVASWERIRHCRDEEDEALIHLRESPDGLQPARAFARFALFEAEGQRR